jgi:hypothetical protein
MESDSVAIAMVRSEGVRSRRPGIGQTKVAEDFNRPPASAIANPYRSPAADQRHDFQLIAVLKQVLRVAGSGDEL